MDNENDVLCEKIINEVHAVFNKDNDLSSFEIIPTLLNQNKSPVIHVDHNLGLESWCAKHVYDYAHKIIINYKLGNNKHLLNNDVIIKYINVALLINPDVTTFWNIRRQLIEKNRLTVDKEFQFSGIVLTKKPKSSEAFSYRRWLFSFQSGESIDWSFEIGICERCADKSSSNYHAWTHRQWVIQKASNFLKTEILLTEKFIKKHIGDYSCYHYRQYILQKLFENEYYDKDYNATTNELIYLKELINFYLIDHVNTLDEIINTLLPGLKMTDATAVTASVNSPINLTQFGVINNDKIKSFLYCCNLASYDIKFCDELKNLFGYRESFENHRRASLKFIVDNCIKLNCKLNYDKYFSTKTTHHNNIIVENDDHNDDNDEQFNHQEPINKLPKFDYTSNSFLLALKKSEGMLGEKHRKWCSLFLGFDYTNNL